MGLIPPPICLILHNGNEGTSPDLIIKPPALINANVNLPHNPGEWALTSDSAGQNCSDLRWCFCSAAQLRLFITHGDCEDYRKSDSFSFLSLIYVLQKKRKCKSDCNVGHMLVVGAVSIVMILIHQSRCTVCPIGLSVCSVQTSKWLFVSESRWEPVRHGESQCDSEWDTHNIISSSARARPSWSVSPYGAEMSFSWISGQFGCGRGVQLMVWSHDRPSVMYSESRARYHDCILPLSHLNFQQQQAIIWGLDSIINIIHVSIIS